MASRSLLLLAALLTAASAQNDSINVWSAVSFILYGERTPLQSSNTPSLTPVGAQQMFEQGSVFRARYIGANTTSTPDEHMITTSAPILGLQRNAIDNSQLTILSTTDSYTAASAAAFLQGLYPPVNQSFAPNAGGLESAVLADGTMINFPLGGYQYPAIETASTQDPNIVWVAGNVACSQWFNSTLQPKSAIEQQVYNQTLGFYQNLWQQIYGSVFPYSLANWDNAYSIYDYVSYHYEHNQQVRDKMDQIGPDTLGLLREYASTQQRDLTGNLTVSGLTQGDMIRAIAGRTLAARVVSQFKESIAWAGGEYKLNLMFGSYEPFMAFFALAGLVNGASGADFGPLPYPGAAMTFELYSIGGNSTVMPETDELMVRFLYRNGTDPSAPFLEYSLFGNSPSVGAMTFDSFVSAMETISVDDVKDWCTMCNSPDIFCPALTDNAAEPSNTISQGKSGLSPAIAGVVGAISALVFIALAAVFAGLLGGLRVVRRDSKGRNSTHGGFKGAEKMASDTDLAVSKGGGRHERTGSWELKNGGKDAPIAGGGAGLSTVAGTGPSTERDRSAFGHKNDEDNISIMDHSPVSPVESV